MTLPSEANVPIAGAATTHITSSLIFHVAQSFELTTNCRLELDLAVVVPVHCLVFGSDENAMASFSSS